MYSSESLVNINSDTFTVTSGRVTRDNGLNFQNHSSCRFDKSFAVGECEGCSSLQLNYNISVSSGGSSRYSTKLAIDIFIYYYNKNGDTYSNGDVQTIHVNPYVSSDGGNNSGAEILNIKSNDIRRVVVVFSFNNSVSDATGSVTMFGLNKELSNKETIAAIGAELGWGGTGGFIFNNKIHQFPANGEGIENSTIWYDLTYENMGLPVSQMVALSQYNRLLGESIEADIGAGNGATLGGMFENLLRTSGDFRGAVRDIIDDINSEMDELNEEEEEPSEPEE